jgi:hypothetical protein
MFQDVLMKWGGYEVMAMDVYTDMFKLGNGFIQKEGEPPGQFKANPIAYYRNKGAKTGHYRVMFEDTFETVLKEVQQADDFSLLNGITYFGRRNVQAHASKMFAMIFDLDGVTDSTLNNLLSGAIVGHAYPVPNYIILSGHGVHLYFIFEEPVSLYPYIKIQLKQLKYALTEKMWNGYTSTEKKVQQQGINQGFRVIGSPAKDDSPEPVVRAFRVNEHPFSLRQLCEYVPKNAVIDEEKLWKESKYTLEEAKKKFPEWYQRVVVNGDKSPKYWDIAGKVHGDNPYALYDWWIRKVKEGASYGHRYFNIMALAIYAAKCDVPYERLREDAYELIPFMNSLKPEKPFTADDVDVALECYDLRYKTFPVKDISKIAGIPIEKNKRNGRKPEQHIKMVNAMRIMRRDVLGEDEYKNNGRPKGSGTAEQIVQEWRAAHTDGRKCDCIRDTGLSKPTVYRWWDTPSELELP